tara:strand:+ start:174494 stop:174640 length:147 start_codon:yes stop_codon:yes gene_type:complete
MNTEIKQYNENQELKDREICNLLALSIEKALTDVQSEIWHGHPVWLLN